MRRLLALPLAAFAVTGCGAPGADLFVAARSGTIPGAALRMRVVDDGRVVCNGRSHDLDSNDLIKARAMVAAIGDEAKRGVSLPPGRPTILRFRIRTQDGTVAFSDSSPGQPKAFYQAQQIIRNIAVGACGLPR
jgi:hypothetical protein